MASAQGLKATKLLPKIPNTPSTRPIIPTITSIIPKTFIIIKYLLMYRFSPNYHSLLSELLIRLLYAL